TEGTVTRWLKQVGDEVAVDEPLLEVSTDKVDTEIPSPFAGTLTEILVGEDETVQVRAPLATIGAAGEAGGGEQSGGEQSGDQQAAEAPQAQSASEPAAAQATPAEAEPEEQPTAQIPEEVTEAPAEAESSGEAAVPSSGGSTGGGATEDVTMPALG